MEETTPEINIDAKLKAVNNEIQSLKESEIQRLKEIYFENSLEHENIKTLNKIFSSLFGTKETQKLMAIISNERKENKKPMIKKNIRSYSDSNVCENSFLAFKSGNQNEKEFNKKNLTMKHIFSDYKDVNFKYNFLFNKTPNLQNKFPNSTFLKFNFQKK